MIVFNKRTNVSAAFYIGKQKGAVPKCLTHTILNTMLKKKRRFGIKCCVGGVWHDCFGTAPFYVCHLWNRTSSPEGEVTLLVWFS